jgi:hypothetical protein
MEGSTTTMGGLHDDGVREGSTTTMGGLHDDGVWGGGFQGGGLKSSCCPVCRPSQIPNRSL